MSGAVEPTTRPFVDGEIKTRHLKKYTRGLEAARAEVRHHVEADEIWARVTDPANVLMAEAHLTSSVFESFDAEPGALGLNMARASGLLSTFSGSVDVSVDGRGLVLSDFEAEAVVAPVSEDSLRDDPNAPDLADEQAAVVHVSGLDLKRIVAAADEVGGHLYVECDPDDQEVTFSAEDDGEFERTFGPKDDEQIEVTESALSFFSVDILEDVVEAITASPPVTIRVGDHCPIDIEYPIKVGGDQPRAGSIRFWQAPRIQDGDSP